MVDDIYVLIYLFFFISSLFTVYELYLKARRRTYARWYAYEQEEMEKRIEAKKLANPMEPAPPLPPDLKP